MSRKRWTVETTNNLNYFTLAAYIQCALNVSRFNQILVIRNMLYGHFVIRKDVSTVSFPMLFMLICILKSGVSNMCLSSERVFFKNVHSLSLPCEALLQKSTPLLIFLPHKLQHQWSGPLGYSFFILFRNRSNSSSEWDFQSGRLSPPHKTTAAQTSRLQRVQTDGPDVLVGRDDARSYLAYLVDVLAGWALIIHSGGSNVQMSYLCLMLPPNREWACFVKKDSDDFL